MLPPPTPLLFNAIGYQTNQKLVLVTVLTGKLLPCATHFKPSSTAPSISTCPWVHAHNYCSQIIPTVPSFDLLDPAFRDVGGRPPERSLNSPLKRTQVFTGNGLRASEGQRASEELAGRQDINYIYLSGRTKDNSASNIQSQKDWLVTYNCMYIVHC